jgi:hypothetical protein
VASDDVIAAGKVSDNPDDDRLATMRHRFTVAMAAYSDSREDELDDLRFMAGSPDNAWQWPADVLATRGAVQGQTINARPCLTINKLPQHVRLVTNEQRQNRPTARVIPADENADPEVAEIFDGIVRHIEYMSDADVAYDTACDNQVTYGEGYIRILTEYTKEDSFEQDIKIGRVRSSFSVYMDPMIQDPCGQDANYCFITEDIPKAEYERMYPDATPVTGMMSQGVGDQTLSMWVSQETVRIAEYFYVDMQKAKLNLYPDNITAFDGTPEDRRLKSAYGKPLRSRESDRRKVMWIKTNGYEVLEEREWAGKYIPVIRVIGNEFEVDGQIYISGLVRNAKDAQRMYNYWVSQEAEMLALAPKAPFIGYGGQFEGYEINWKTANTNNWPYLEVNPDVTDGAGNPLPLPERAQPPMAQTGLIQAKMGAGEDIKSTTGQYDSSIGATSNERTGRAILARERQGDTSTYHYVDNLARAVKYVARQLVDLIPKIYDTQRVARIINVEGEVGMARINPQQPEAVRKIVDEQGIEIMKIYNPNVGTYDVHVSSGPSYMTRKQEAMDTMGQILQTNPALWGVAGDLFVKNMDWPGAETMAKRFEKMLDPKVLQDTDESPEAQAMRQQIVQMSQMMEQTNAQIQQLMQSYEMQKLAIDEQNAQIKAYDAETKRLSAMQAGLSPEQISDIVQGTIAAALDTGDIVPRNTPMQTLPGMEPQ